MFMYLSRTGVDAMMLQQNTLDYIIGWPDTNTNHAGTFSLIFETLGSYNFYSLIFIVVNCGAII